MKNLITVQRLVVEACAEAPAGASLEWSDIDARIRRRIADLPEEQRAAIDRELRLMASDGGPIRVPEKMM